MIINKYESVTIKYILEVRVKMKNIVIALTSFRATTEEI